MRRWPTTLRILSAYGRAARIRSCALRILLAATISMALVIFCVFLMLAIFVRISFAPAMVVSEARRGEEVFAQLLERRVVFLREFRLVVDRLDERGGVRAG